MKNKQDITGIILAGGKSSRMGTDKGVMLVAGRAMIERVIQTLSSFTNKIIIIANNNNYNTYGYPVLQDLIKDCGPMGGIYTGLEYSTTPFSIVMSCDIPFVELDTLHQLAIAEDSFDVVVPKHNGKIEPLCARYSRRCSPRLETLLNKGEFKMKDALKGFNVLELEISNCPAQQFSNINTREELNQFNTVQL